MTSDPLSPASGAYAQRSHVNLLECALARAHACNFRRMNTYKTPRNSRKTRHFNPRICNTCTDQRCNPFGMNRCTKHTGWGAPLLAQRAPRRPKGGNVRGPSEGSGGGNQRRTRSLPMFEPVKSMLMASGARSRPSTKVSRCFNLRIIIHLPNSAPASVNREA